MWSPDRPKLTREYYRNRTVILKAKPVCYVCGKPGADQVDHLTPRSRGGSDDMVNLAPIHREPCHRLKSQQESRDGIRSHSAKRPPRKHPGFM